MAVAPDPDIAIAVAGVLVLYRPAPAAVSPAPELGGAVHRHVLHRRELRRRFRRPPTTYELIFVVDGT